MRDNVSETTPLAGSKRQASQSPPPGKSQGNNTVAAAGDNVVNEATAGHADTDITSPTKKLRLDVDNSAAVDQPAPAEEDGPSSAVPFPESSENPAAAPHLAVDNVPGLSPAIPMMFDAGMPTAPVHYDPESAVPVAEGSENPAAVPQLPVDNIPSLSPAIPMLLDAGMATPAAVNQPAPAEDGPSSFVLAENPAVFPQLPVDNISSASPTVPMMVDAGATGNQPVPAEYSLSSAVSVPDSSENPAAVPQLPVDNIGSFFPTMPMNQPSPDGDGFPSAVLGPESSENTGAVPQPPFDLPANDISSDFPAIPMHFDAETAMPIDPALSQPVPSEYRFPSTVSVAESAEFPIPLPLQMPGNSFGSLFPSIPVLIDAGASTGRVWCPTNASGEFDPHWKEWPRNWNHPGNPGEGNVEPLDLHLPDSALPARLHRQFRSLAAQGTLFSSTINSLNAVTQLIDDCYDIEEEARNMQIPKCLLTQPCPAHAPPTNNTNPFMGVDLAEEPEQLRASLGDAIKKVSVPLAEGVKVPKALPRTIVGGEKFQRDTAGRGVLLISREWMEQTRTPMEDVPWFPWDKKRKWKGKAKDIQPVAKPAGGADANGEGVGLAGDRVKAETAGAGDNADKEISGKEGSSAGDSIKARICGPVFVEDGDNCDPNTEIEAQVEQDPAVNPGDTEASVGMTATDIDRTKDEEEVAGVENDTATAAMEIDNNNTAAPINRDTDQSEPVAGHATAAGENRQPASSGNGPRRRVSRFAYPEEAEDEDEGYGHSLRDGLSSTDRGAIGDYRRNNTHWDQAQETDWSRRGTDPADFSCPLTVSVARALENRQRAKTSELPANTDNGQLGDDRNDEDGVDLLQLPELSPRSPFSAPGMAASQAEMAATAQPNTGSPDPTLGKTQSAPVASNGASHPSSSGKKHDFGLDPALPGSDQQ
ncbi:hypothetical protein C8A03DRAFT_38341, partial [Achaetomium macrosporum]